MIRHICLIGMNHNNSPVEARERFALSDPCWSAQRPIPVDLDGEGLGEAVVLSTCNRVEIVAVGQGRDVSETVLRHWAAAAGAPVEDLRPHVYTLHGLAAVEHLFRVASSLDSMIIGEPQILGQVKDAFRLAVEQGTAKTILNRLFHKAFFVAKLIRSQTDIAARAVSVSFAACELAKRIFGDISSCRALLIGAGEMAELAAQHLIRAGVKSLCICNRTQARAEELACAFNCLAAPFAHMEEALAEADVIISSTGAGGAVINRDMAAAAMRRRRGRPMFFIDIAVPRDVAPAVHQLDNVYVYDIDDLKTVVSENMALRREEADRAAGIIAAEVAEFAAWLESMDLAPTIADLVQRGERLAEEELGKTLRRLGPVTPDVEAALRDMLTGLLKKLNHDPIAFLKGQPMGRPTRLKYVGLARQIFNLDNPGRGVAQEGDGPAPELDAGASSEVGGAEQTDRELWKK